MLAIATRAATLRAARRSVTLALLAGSAAGCSHLTRLGVGPVAARPGDGKPAYGDELRLRAAAGTSDGDELAAVEVEGRLLVAERTSALSVGLGPTYLRWVGPAALLMSLTPAFGAEYFDRTVLATAGLHAGLGLGLVLRDAEHTGRSGFGWPEMELGEPDRYLHVDRRRMLLTLELTGAADARSRGASLAAGLLVGLAWSDEQFTRQAPPLVPTWFFKRPLRQRAPLVPAP